MSPPPTQNDLLSGWGNYPVLSCKSYRPQTRDELQQILALPDPGYIARGAGRSYGDAAISKNTSVVHCERFKRILHYDEETGFVGLEAGITIGEIITAFLPEGWFPSVVPGTKHVTLAGAIAADIHGKNHHKDGSFADSVHSIKIMLATGEILNCSREICSDLFFATLGGMGLTGIILEAELFLRRVETKFIKLKKLVAEDFTRLCDTLETAEQSYTYSVAWLDCLASGKAAGRGVVLLGNHAELTSLPPDKRPEALKLTPHKPMQIPCPLPAGLINRLSIGIFNELYYRKAQISPDECLQEYDPYFFPLDALSNWNRLYGAPGFTQYQCVIPSNDARQVMSVMLRTLQENSCFPSLAVLKRFGAQEGLLSFPMPGYTLALDLARQPALPAVLAKLDALVSNHGGRVYLAKDAYLSAESFRSMYPKHGEWLAIKNRYDGNNRFSSSLSQRLRMHEP